MINAVAALMLRIVHCSLATNSSAVCGMENIGKVNLMAASWASTLHVAPAEMTLMMAHGLRVPILLAALHVFHHQALVSTHTPAAVTTPMLPSRTWWLHSSR
jgi:hypothetical protein